MSNPAYQEKRIKSLEDWRSEQNTFTALRNQRDKHLDERFDRVEKGLDEVKGYLLRIVWVIIIAILSYLMTFIVSGNLIS